MGFIVIIQSQNFQNIRGNFLLVSIELAMSGICGRAAWKPQVFPIDFRLGTVVGCIAIVVFLQLNNQANNDFIFQTEKLVRDN